MVNAVEPTNRQWASSDDDGDSVPNIADVYPKTPAGLAFDSTGRPHRDCNGDCVYDAADIQCIVDELIGQ